MKISVASCWLVFLALAAVSVSGSAQAQATAPSNPPSKEVVFPVLPKSGADVDAFVPAGWQLDAKTTGDLNGDGKSDLLFVLINSDPNLVMQGNPVVPRIIAVAFANASGSGYTLAIQNSTLLTLRVNGPTIDMMDGSQPCFAIPTPTDCSGILSIAHGAFQVFIQSTRGSGGQTFIFRFQNGGAELIGYKDVATEGGITDTDEVNFSTGQSVDTQQDLTSTKPGKTTKKTLPKNPLPNLQTMGNVQDFEGTY